MRNALTLAALLFGLALVGCDKDDAGLTAHPPPSVTVPTPMAATPASSPASDPSLPDAASAMASSASAR